MSERLVGVYGVGGCGRGVMPLVRAEAIQQGLTLDRVVFVDDQPPARSVNGQPVLAYDEFLATPAESRSVVIAIADGAARARVAGRCERDGVRLGCARADSVVVMDDVTVGLGAILSPFVTLTSNIRIGRHFHANLYSYVEHDCVIGDFVTFAPAVKCNGNVMIGDFAYVGAGAVIRQGKADEPLVIGRGAVIGMGAVVTRSVSPGIVVAGNPARPLGGR
jgi:sugar O-acyltransferase (sialic acid O-acetyltransferase NeuD family)